MLTDKRKDTCKTIIVKRWKKLELCCWVVWPTVPLKELVRHQLQRQMVQALPRMKPAIQPMGGTRLLTTCKVLGPRSFRDLQLEIEGEQDSNIVQ